MTLAAAFLLLSQIGPAPSQHVGDGQPLTDPMRPVVRIARDGFTLQYYTRIPCASTIELRAGDIPRIAYGVSFDQKVRTYTGASGAKTTFHTLTVRTLEPGKRYYYRIWEPGFKPTDEEKNWGASNDWHREYAVSTEAPKGEKTIIHLPVKVLLMPNVINVQSAVDDGGKPIAAEPKQMSPEDLQKVKDEFATSARFFWVNSGMRLWVDYQIFVDDRWQRWGDEPAKVDAFYKGWPTCRSYPGKDYADPGGGDFTILDTKNIQKTNKEPVVEGKPYSGQIEVAFVRKWNGVKWDYYNSGGGTYGVDEFPHGVPGRSQFLGGGDLAWLATHEFHHDLESHGQFSFANREDERIVFNHPAPRFRRVKGDGTADENDWNTAGRSGEHWQTMWFWDRTLSDAQWLRFYFGYTITVKDADEDGFPDNDPRLPLDEARFGSSPQKAMTDGEMTDLDKVMLSTWAPGPLQSTWVKQGNQIPMPNPTKADSDGDGIPDDVDPYPLIPYQPFVYPLHVTLDGDPAEWADVPLAGKMDKGGIEATYKQAYDEAGYYGLLIVKGPWRRVQASFDGEGQGVYSGVGVQGFELQNLTSTGRAPGPSTSLVDIRPYMGQARGLKWKAKKLGDDSVAVEFMWPNRGDGIWYWDGAGHEIGSTFTFSDLQNRAFSMWDPYQLFYSRMLEPAGRQPIPGGAPAELAPLAPVQVLKPGDPSIVLGTGWKLDGNVYRCSGGDESLLTVKVPKIGEFDLFTIIEAKNDATLAAFAPATKNPTTANDYVGFVGGYGNRTSKLRLFGREVGDEAVTMTPGTHRIQLSRRDGSIWLIVDGKTAVWAPDPNPKATIDRLAIVGGFGGDQVVHEIRIKT